MLLPETKKMKRQFEIMLARERGEKLIPDDLGQWFSTAGVPRNPWVPWKALEVPPISDLVVFLLVNFDWGAGKFLNNHGKVL